MGRYNYDCEVCSTEIKKAIEWGIGYCYCPKCREDRTEFGKLIKYEKFAEKKKKEL